MEITTPRKKETVNVVLILAAAFLPYINTLSAMFVYDDISLVINNPLIKGWDRLGQLFTSGYWAALGGSYGLYRPITTLSFLVEYSTAGLNPFLFHLDNVLLHMLCSVLVYMISRVLLTEGNAALFAALLFSVHPVHTEAVSWVSGRAELLCAYFSLLSIWLFMQKPGDKRYLFMSLAAFFLGLFSKESAIVVPALLAAYVMLFDSGRKGMGRIVIAARRIYPYALVFIGYMAIRLIVLKGAIGPQEGERYFKGTGGYDTFLSICKVFTHYIRLAFLPFSMRPIYMFQPPHSFFRFEAIFPIAVLLLTIIFAGRIIRFSRTAFFALSWFFIALFPVSNIIPVGVLMSERALYLPSFAPCILLGIAVSGERYRDSGFERKQLTAASALVLAVIAVFAAGTISRNTVWKDEATFWTRLVRDLPDSPYAHRGLGNSLMERDMTDEAIAEFKVSIDLNYSKAETHEYLGNAYVKKGMLAEAIDEYNVAIGLKPNIASAHSGLAIAYGQSGQLDRSIGEFQEAIRLNPYLQNAHSNLGVAYGIKGETAKAIEEFNTALRMDPDDRLAKENLEKAYAVKDNKKGEGR